MSSPISDTSTLVFCIQICCTIILCT